VPVHEALLAEIYQVQSAIGQMTGKSDVIQFDEKLAILQVEQKEEILRERRIAVREMHGQRSPKRDGGTARQRDHGTDGRLAKCSR